MLDMFYTCLIDLVTFVIFTEYTQSLKSQFIIFVIKILQKTIKKLKIDYMCNIREEMKIPMYG